jgi:predicted glutamine amidotransferase
MCGINAVIIGRKKRRPAAFRKITEQFTALMVATEVRGRHAAGAFVVNKSGTFMYKAPGPASKVTGTAQWAALMEQVGRDTVAIIGHTRFATQGRPEVNENNHPLRDQHITGVHNGTIYNDRELGERYGSTAEVDSAAIMASLRHRTQSDVLTKRAVTEAMAELDGGFAVLVSDSRKPEAVYLARNGVRPAVIARDRHKDLLWVASTRAILMDAGIRWKVTLPMPNTVTRLTSAEAHGKELRPTYMAGAAKKSLSAGLSLDGGPIEGQPKVRVHGITDWLTDNDSRGPGSAWLPGQQARLDEEAQDAADIAADYTDVEGFNDDYVDTEEYVEDVMTDEEFEAWIADKRAERKRLEGVLR